MIDEIRGDRLGEPDHRCFGGAVDVAIGNATDRRHRRRNVHDRARLLLQHAGKEGFDGAVHGFDVEIEGKIPVAIAAPENAAVVHVAGAVHQDIQGAEFASHHLGDGVDIVLRAHIQLDALCRFKIADLVFRHIGGDDAFPVSHQR